MESQCLYYNELSTQMSFNVNSNTGNVQDNRHPALLNSHSLKNWQEKHD